MRQSRPFLDGHREGGRRRRDFLVKVDGQPRNGRALSKAIVDQDAVDHLGIADRDAVVFDLAIGSQPAGAKTTAATDPNARDDVGGVEACRKVCSSKFVGQQSAQPRRGSFRRLGKHRRHITTRQSD